MKLINLLILKHSNIIYFKHDSYEFVTYCKVCRIDMKYLEEKLLNITSKLSISSINHFKFSQKNISKFIRKNKYYILAYNEENDIMCLFENILISNIKNFEYVSNKKLDKIMDEFKIKLAYQTIKK